MSAPRRPAPTPDATSRPFWDALAAGRLVLQVCAACGRAQHYPRERCAHCWSDRVDWHASRARGRVWTWTVVHRPGHAAFADAAPYAVVVVELLEGPRVLTAFDGDPASLALGAPVEVVARAEGDHDVMVARIVVETP